VIGRLESDGRIQAVAVGSLAVLLASAAAAGLTGRVAVPLAAIAVAVGLAVGLLLLLLRRMRFVIGRLGLIHPGAVPAEAPPPVRIDPGEVLRRAVPDTQVGSATEQVRFDLPVNRIWWYVPGFGTSSGGHANILAMVAELERAGVRSTIVLTDVSDPVELAGTRAAMCANYPPTLARVIARHDVATVPGDVLVATDWRSVRATSEDRGERRAHYFVQDHEVEFAPTGTWSALAAGTYRAGLRHVTLGRGLSELLTSRYDVPAAWTPIGIDPGIYRPTDPTPSSAVAAVRQSNPDGLPVLLVYGRQDTARRAVELSLAGLEIAARRGARFLCVLFGEDVALDGVTFPWTCAGVLPPRELAALYRTADLGIVLSLTNPSLVPQEMLACGLPVLEADTALTRIAFGELEGCRLAAPHPERLADAVVELLAEPARRRQPVAVPTHAEAAAALHEQLVGRALAAPQPLSAAPSVTVAIPTLDPDPEIFARLLAALDAQRYPGRVELRVIDSGSQQPVAELLAEVALPVHLHHTTRAEFRHGPTRNLLIEWSDTDFVALLTQDAVPVGDRWLFDLVAACAIDDRVAGAFCRHRPPADAARVAAVELVEHFDRLAMLHPSPATPATAPVEDETYDAQFFFSNNGAILRREAWTQVPFRDVAFGEDQVWSRDVLRAGWSVNFARHAVVEHLNRFTEAEHEERAAVVHAWDLKYWAGPMGTGAIDRAAAREYARARRIVSAHGLSELDRAVEVGAIRARERGWRRALAEATGDTEWFRAL